MTALATAPTDPQPTLAPPGAGVPGVERFVGGLVVRLSARFGSRDSANRALDRERKAIRSLLASIPRRSAGVRVLIPRLRGLEDSRRYWSAWMTLDHLRIVNEHVARIIGMLRRGAVPPGRAGTADVKPSPECDERVVGAYEASCDEVLRCADGPSPLRTRARFAHPWFGPLDAACWHSLAGMHMGIHRRQLIEIVRRLDRTES